MKKCLSLLATVSISSLLGACSVLPGHSDATSQSSIKISQTTSKKAASKSDAKKTSTKKEATAKVVAMENVDAKNLSIENCGQWALAVYAKENKLSDSEMKAYSAQVLTVNQSPDGFVYALVMKGQKEVAKYRFTAAGEIQDAKTSKILGKKPIILVNHQFTITKAQGATTGTASSANSSSSSASANTKDEAFTNKEYAYMAVMNISEYARNFDEMFSEDTYPFSGISESGNGVGIVMAQSTYDHYDIEINGDNITLKYRDMSSQSNAQATYTKADLAAKYGAQKANIDKEIARLEQNNYQDNTSYGDE